MLTTFFIRRGWSRDDWKWPIAQIATIAGLVASGMIDVPYWFGYLGIPLSVTALHWILVAAGVISYYAGKNQTSKLPSAYAMASGSVAGSPVAKAEQKIDNVSRLGSLILILALAGGMAACTKAPPNLTPEATASFNALRVGHAIDIVRDTAIDAEAQKLISTADARLIMDWHSAVVRTIKAAPGGWTPTVLAAIDQLKTDLLPAAWQRIAIYIDLLKAVIKEVA